MPDSPRQPPRHATRAMVIAALLVSAAVAAVVVWFEDAASAPFRLVCALSTLAAAGLTAAVIALSRRHFWSVTSLYAFVFALFHFGMTAVYGLGLPLESTYDSRRHLEWFHSTATSWAVVASVAGFGAFAVGAWAAELIPRRGRDGPLPEAPPLFGWVGAALLGGGVFAWLLLVMLSGGLGLMASGYDEFLRATADTPIGVVYYVIGFGLVLCVAGPPGLQRRAGLLGFAAWAVVAFPIGLRGEVLFPSVTAAGIYAMRRRPFPTRWVAPLVVLALWAISFGREIRQVGIGDVWHALGNSNPVLALTEMGSSLRPVVEVVGWAESGEEYDWGQTIVAPFDRTLSLVVPTGRRVAGEEDFRIMNVLVRHRVGTIGFSPVAEGYRNAGLGGVVMMMLATGLVLGAIDSLRPTPFRQLFAGVLFLALLIQVRNDFFFVPIYVALGWVLAVGVYVAHELLAARRGASGAAGAAR